MEKGYLVCWDDAYDKDQFFTLGRKGMKVGEVVDVDWSNFFREVSEAESYMLACQEDFGGDEEGIITVVKVQVKVEEGLMRVYARVKDDWKSLEEING